jgi:tetratricopeptide (TPR) repeat protein
MTRALMAAAVLLVFVPAAPWAGEEGAPRLEAGDPAYHSDLGDRHLEEGRYEDSIAEYRKVLDLLPKAVYERVQIGFAYEKLGSRKQAHTLFKDAVGIYPDFAEDAFRIAIEVDPKNAEAHYGLGLSFSARARQDMAVLSCEEAVRLDPGHAEAHLALGTAYLELQDKELVEREFEILRTINPELAEKLRPLL